jgi:hypothetical protein
MEGWVLRGPSSPSPGKTPGWMSWQCTWRPVERSCCSGSSPLKASGEDRVNAGPAGLPSRPSSPHQPARIAGRNGVGARSPTRPGNRPMRPSPSVMLAPKRRRMSANSDRGTATSANWNTTYRPWRTILAPILTSFLRSVVSDQCSTSSEGQRAHEVGQVVGQGVELEPHGVVAERMAGQARPAERVLALADPLLRSAAAVVELDHPPVGPRLLPESPTAARRYERPQCEM